MSCKEVIGDLYNIFPSDSRRKHWQEQDLDIAEKTVQHVRRSVDGLLKDDRFLNAVDATEAVRSLSFLSIRDADRSNSRASASILTLIPLSRSWYYSFFLGNVLQPPLRVSEASLPTSLRLSTLCRCIR